MAMAGLNWGMILGGFGLFMFGIKFMGDGLKAVAGDKLRDYIQKYTSNPVSGLLIGIVITIIMQSSSATSAISIGLVRAGLMTLDQAAGIILGATIGTTVTSFLISINIEKYAMFIVFAGSMLICFAKKRRYMYIGNVILGFGLMRLPVLDSQDRGKVDVDQVCRMADRFIAEGGTYFDTAYVYDGGRSEEARSEQSEFYE